MFHSRWRLALKVVPVVLGVIAVKFLCHYFGGEILSLSPLFTAVVSANIFLLGFLISGVLVDYKESEKIPGEMASSLEAMADEGAIILKMKKSDDARAFLEHIVAFNQLIVDWFHGRERTTTVMADLTHFNDDFSVLENQTQAAFIARLKQEQNILRKLITRAHTIRDTEFLGTGYAIAEIISAVLIIGLVFIKMEPFYESVFFVTFVSFMLIYMIQFIKDLDNPFGYAEGDNMVEDVPLKPLFDSKQRIEKHLE